MNYFPHLLHRNKIGDSRFKRDRVHGDLSHIDSPRVGAVGVATKSGIVPVQARRLLVLAPRPQGPARFDVTPAGAHELILGASLAKQAAVQERPLQPKRGSFDQLPDDHRGARSDSRPAVGDGAGIGPRDFYAVKPDPERIGCDLRKNGIRPLPDFSAGCQDADATLRSGFHFHNRGERDFARSGEPCSMHERRESNAAFDTRTVIFVRKAFALGLIIAFLEGAIEQAVQVHLFVQDLSCRGRLVFAKEIPAAKFFRWQIYGTRNLIEVALDRKNTLRRAKAE